MNTDKIYLVGFMGSGKNSVGHELADQLRWDFLDMDAEIEKKEGMPITKIFEDKGVEYFRDLETIMLKELLPVRAGIIATGGGAFERVVNREIMFEDGLVVWPYTPFKDCMERLSKPEETAKRPLLNQLKRKQLRTLFDERRRNYGRAHMVANGVGSPADVADCIIKRRVKYL